MDSKNVKIVVYVPETHAGAVREAMGKAGAGQIGNYSFCSFSSKGIGRSLPGDGAQPFIGTVGKLEEIPEERIEVTCARKKLSIVITEMRRVHPYEEVAFDVYALEGE